MTTSGAVLPVGEPLSAVPVHRAGPAYASTRTSTLMFPHAATALPDGS